MTDETNTGIAKRALKEALEELNKEIAYSKVAMDLEKVIKTLEDAAPTVEDIKMKKLTCTRCGNEYPKRFGDTPIMGEIKDYFQVVVEDSNAKEAVMHCKRCKRLFIAPMGIYIRVVVE